MYYIEGYSSPENMAGTRVWEDIDIIVPKDRLHKIIPKEVDND